MFAIISSCVSISLEHTLLNFVFSSFYSFDSSLFSFYNDKSTLFSRAWSIFSFVILSFSFYCCNFTWNWRFCSSSSIIKLFRSLFCSFSYYKACSLSDSSALDAAIAISSTIFYFSTMSANSEFDMKTFSWLTIFSLSCFNVSNFSIFSLRFELLSDKDEFVLLGDSIRFVDTSRSNLCSSKNFSI